MTKEEILIVTDVISKELNTKEQLVNKYPYSKTTLVEWIRQGLVEVSEHREYLFIGDVAYNKLNDRQSKINPMKKFKERKPKKPYKPDILVAKFGYIIIDAEVRLWFKQKLSNQEFTYTNLTNGIGTTRPQAFQVLFVASTCRKELYERMLIFKNNYKR